MAPTPKVISLFLDAASEAKVRLAWASAAKGAGIADKLGELEFSRPHVSLGIYAEGQTELILEGLREVAAGQAPFELSFDALGVFNGARGTLFFAPASSDVLLHLHRICHERVASLGRDWRRDYLPGRLIFHCSINFGLERADLVRALDAALDVHLPIVARVESLGLLQEDEKSPGHSFSLLG